MWTELLVASDKHEILKLKEHCEATIITQVDVGIAVEVLLQADALQCKTLLGGAMDFFKVHIDSLGKENKKLAKAEDQS